MSTTYRADFGRTGRTGYSFLISKDGKFLNTDTLEKETFSSSDYADYLITGAEVGSTGVMVFTVPTGAPADTYYAYFREVEDDKGDPDVIGNADQSDPSPASPTQVDWDGAAVIDSLDDGLDASVALITLADAKQFLGETGLESDSILCSLINSVSAWITAQVGVELLETTRTEYYNGDGSRELLLLNRPVQSITSVHIDANRVFGSDTEVDVDSDVMVNLKAGILELWNTLGAWSCGRANIKVVYVSGYAIEDMPHDIRQAVRRTLERQWIDGFTNRKLDRRSDVIGDANTTYNDPGLAKDVESLIAKYQSYIDCPQFHHAD